MKINITLELELVSAAKGMSEEAVDTWAWALERQVEALDLVEKADVIDVEYPPDPEEVPPDAPQMH